MEVKNSVHSELLVFNSVFGLVFQLLRRPEHRRRELALFRVQADARHREDGHI